MILGQTWPLERYAAMLRQTCPCEHKDRAFGIRYLLAYLERTDPSHHDPHNCGLDIFEVQYMCSLGLSMFSYAQLNGSSSEQVYHDYPSVQSSMARARHKTTRDWHLVT